MLDQFRRWFRSKGSATNFIGFDKYRKAGAYHWREFQANPEYRALMTVFAQYLKPDSNVLDIGCGDGAYLGNCAGMFAQGMGIDAEPVAIELAKSKFSENRISNCAVMNLRIDEARVYFAGNPRRFDVVWSADVIEHLPDPSELLMLAREVLAEGGLVLIGTPLFISDELVSPYHVKEFTTHEIRSLIEEFFHIDREHLLAQSRRDGKLYPDSYYIACCRSR
jgi:2-polyprenyl-3-methyl-5-hydroxy-6-metoxy-1,4-benzoquinol methylase